MNRTIKFRAWDGKKMWQYAVPLLSKAYNGGTINVSDNKDGSFNQFINGELMQFTGLHDNTKWEELTEDERTKWTLAGNIPSEWKGKPIYEGDVVKFVRVQEKGFHCAGGFYENNNQQEFRGVIKYDSGSFQIRNVDCYPFEEILCKWSILYSKELNSLILDSVFVNTERHGGNDTARYSNIEVIGNIYENPELLESK